MRAGMVKLHCIGWTCRIARRGCRRVDERQSCGQSDDVSWEGERASLNYVPRIRPVDLLIGETTNEDVKIVIRFGLNFQRLTMICFI